MKTFRLHLHTWGAKLRRREGMFEVTNVTAKGKVIQTRTFAAATVQSIQLNEGATLSADAVRLALEHDVDIIFQDRRGMPIGRIDSPLLGSTARVRRGQLRLADDVQGLVYCAEWLRAKIEAQRALLDGLAKKQRRSIGEATLAKTDKQLRKQFQRLSVVDWERPMSELQPHLRGLEGTAARAYFAVLGQAPPAAFRFMARSRRPATDAFNAALNYGYGMLYPYVERALLRAGLSPYIGFLHRDGYRFKALVYDFIEPYRPLIDGTVLNQFLQRRLTRTDFTAVAGEGIRIGLDGRKQLAEAIDRQLCVRKRLYLGKKQTTENQLQLEAYRLARRCAELVANDADNI